MKAIDLVVTTLLIIGGLNWGIIGLFNIDLVGLAFGNMSLLARAVYTLVGLSAVYEAVGFRTIQHRWEHPAHGMA